LRRRAARADITEEQKMTIQTTTHLNFRGDARQALDFYQSVFGGHVVINTYADFGMPAEVPGADKVVFGLVTAENGFRVMGYDIPGQLEGSLAGGGSTRRENNTTITDQALFVSIGAGTLDELQSYWDALAVDAVIVEPLAASAWSAGFGMLTDRFGVTWSVTVTV
jgi:PhnB protein